MKKTLTYCLVALLCMVSSCSKNEEGISTSLEQIHLEVADMSSIQTRTQLFDNYDDLISQGNFTLDAYLKNNGNNFIDNAWVYYFLPDDAVVGEWRFRDVVNQGNLINFYWPNYTNLDFVAYLPRELSKTACESVSDISYTATNGVNFTATMPAVINDRTEEERIAENAKQELVYACRLDQGKEAGSVKLRFVHPFATIRFRLHQSHRDLQINSITLYNVNISGEFSSGQDTFEPYLSNNLGQDYLTYSNWIGTESGSIKINLDKVVPDDINYQSQIGGPYLVIPQILNDSNRTINLSVNYTWNGETVESAQYPIATASVPAWQPGKKYTYTLDLGDNKEEILFKIIVEEWEKGEEDGYENNYEVQ
ncbi:MAG: fimbrillin family protein [Tidjanibacter sp.]|nr:fimbrillin family protein [Tidjanibacter sp.]